MVFFHGMYMNYLCWEHWIEYFQNRGYLCLAPVWPGRNQPTSELRNRHPDAKLGELTLDAVVNQFILTFNTLDEKPIIVGHSLGGFVLQLILQKTWPFLVSQLILHHRWGSFQPNGNFLNSNWAHISPFIPRSRPIAMSFERF
jgi:pimeloyl-ACP methyl ester carboxylesterase